MVLEFKHCPKEDILECVLKHYNPDKTTIEIADIFNFFKIEFNDILKAQDKFTKQRDALCEGDEK